MALWLYAFIMHEMDDIFECKYIASCLASARIRSNNKNENPNTNQKVEKYDIHEQSEYDVQNKMTVNTVCALMLKRGKIISRIARERKMRSVEK